MTYFSNHSFFTLNQDMSSLCATNPHIYGKIECFQFSSEDIPNVKYIEKPMLMGSFGSVNQTSLLQDLSQYCTPQHFSAFQTVFATSFPDFDFSTISPWHFKLLPSREQAQNNINWILQTELSNSEYLVNHLWQTLDKEIGLATSSIYIYEPDSPDAFSEMGAVFNHLYLFVNDKSKKVVLFNLRKGAGSFDSTSDDDDLFDDVEERLGYSYF